MRTPRHALIAAALIGLAACGAPASSGIATRNDAGSPAVQAAPTPAQATVYFGGQYRFADGITVIVSAPKPFQPSTSAYPHSDRAVAFEIAIRNDGSQPYRLSGLSVSATFDGAGAKQVVDPTQGYSGIVDAGKDVPVGRDVRVTVAFAVSEQPAQLRLSLKPTATSSVVAVYSGSA
ncbi:hypothetical protein [Amycolatopsis alkalitolerans]|uniref:DUF4352 domain-containing protein n=1 Tax=Amycolatopsis alkalitolerans TaxID=2547244 RepID=A0A5C4LVA8_9PSEU|nr:hypothetical protein [Amycolatopsis alkalitolerans]TNC23334.1 hypothetical protein FG385_21555 [Amycolatopsis alkalitolerans]